MSHALAGSSENYVLADTVDGASPFVIVCEHASNHIPPKYDGLGLPEDARNSHVAWDPGALAVGKELAKRLDASLVASTISRLVYDCNRPPAAPDAMPTRSETTAIPGNMGLTKSQRDARIAEVYLPFKTGLRGVIAKTKGAVLVTVHSFTPVYHGVRRPVEVGILHDSDTRLADAMLQAANTHTTAKVQRNAPYGPDDGVTHTLKEHAITAGHLNVMIEIRSDLIATPAQQEAMSATMARWIKDAYAMVVPQKDAQCQA